MAYNTKAVANRLLDLAKAQGMKITPMKLQKLMFFAHGWHLAVLDEPLLDEPVEAWQYGPVVDSLYHEFKGYGNRPIDRPATDLDTTAFEYIVPVLSEADSKVIDPLLRRILDTYGKFSAVQLSNMTHEPGTPWAITWDKVGGVRRNADIDDGLIKQYFLARRKAQ